MHGGTSKKEALIKRVVAVEGDQEVRAESFINGEGQDEEDFIAELQNISLDLGGSSCGQRVGAR
jgi:hypothetical protein